MISQQAYQKYHAQKSLKFALIMELAQLKFTYTTQHSSKNTSSRPLSGLTSEYNSVQSLSGSWFDTIDNNQVLNYSGFELIYFSLFRYW